MSDINCLDIVRGVARQVIDFKTDLMTSPSNRPNGLLI